MKKRVKKRTKDDTTVLDLFAEVGLLKRVRRSGWWTIGIKDGESVADHSFRCAIIGYCLAQLEGCDPERTALICLFNDIHEARINDLHKVAQRYINLKEAEQKAFNEQIKSLPTLLRDSITDLLKELWSDTTPESQLARDADILECMLQGKEYYEEGHPQAKPFFNKSLRLIKTKSARRLARQLKTWNSRRWLKKLVVMER